MASTESLRSMTWGTGSGVWHNVRRWRCRLSGEVRGCQIDITISSIKDEENEPEIR